MKKIKIQNRLKNNVTGILSVVLFFSLSLFFSCDDEESAVDGIPPSTPVNIMVKEAIPGGAIISYDIPIDKDLLYVQARYEVNGIERTSKATPYENTLTVDGFGEIKEYSIWISAVDKSGNRSAEEKVMITPLIPPADMAFATLRADEAFGGIVVRFDNEAKKELIIETMVKDSVGMWQTLDNRASKKEKEEFLIKDGIVFSDSPQEFLIFLRDRWGNVSDSLLAELKPMYEEEIDFHHVETSSYADDDDWWPNANNQYVAKNLTDGIFNYSNNYIYHAGPNTTWPVSLTIDLGTEIKISSYKLYPRWTFEYKNHCLKSWQIWARLDAPPVTTEDDPDFAPARNGNWKIGDVYANIEGDSGWMLISQTSTARPSGPDGPITSDDIAYARAGEDHSIPLDIAKSYEFRYVKFCIQTSYSNSYASCAEVTFFGEYQGEKPEI
ncbi:MAG: DUF4959 domain-containing protein [Draconibacterium sp.]